MSSVQIRHLVRNFPCVWYKTPRFFIHLRQSQKLPENLKHLRIFEGNFQLFLPKNTATFPFEKRTASVIISFGS